MITIEQLIAIMPNTKLAFDGTGVSRADKFLPYLNKYMEEFKINTRLRVCHFLAQIAHESGELRCLEENLNYSYEGLLKVFPKYFNAVTAKAYARNPRKIASRVYANRMGNGSEATCDGYNYRGRGLIQLTGKSNYANYAEYCGFDVVKKPELIGQPLGGTRSTCWFWASHDLNTLADKDDLKTITKRINGGYNGLAEREKYLNRAKRVIK